MARRRGEESADLIDAEALADLVPGTGDAHEFRNVPADQLLSTCFTNQYQLKLHSGSSGRACRCHAASPALARRQRTVVPMSGRLYRP
jgi:hypothetical protein